METVLTELLKSSPGIAGILISLFILIRYIASKDTLQNEQFNRIETMHNKTMDVIDRNTQAFGTITEVIRKCQDKSK